MDQMTLKRIDLSKNCRGQGASSCEHLDIKPDKLYLTKINGSYFIGRFLKVWFGWSFSGWHSCIQLDAIQAVWEITELPNERSSSNEMC